ncbi:TIGR04222 domain-containing membrane protein [Nonomuraea zeae]|uniref:TIGR04222 domain-containing membrane protein n=1 Tax=Nonomuraea zeae TaxID=1642303 RepID=UPI001478CA2C|nr:TIGR04222 domain-containing membrane protein [Nonomuraea zeae]
MDRNELAYLSGGPHRVALAALVTLVLEGRMRLSYAGKLYAVAGATGGDPVEEIALLQRSTLPEALAAVAGHESVRAVEEDLIRRELVTRSWLGRFRRATPAGRRLIEQAGPAPRGSVVGVALDGLAGISDEKIRRQFGGSRRKRGSLRGQGTGGWDATGNTLGGDGTPS